MSLADLETAAKTFGKFKLSPKSYTRLESQGEVFESAVIAGYQDVPPKSYFPSVDVAIIRYHSQKRSIPNDIYLLRAKVNQPISAIGKADVVSELVKTDGTVAFACPHVGDVSSVDLPADRKTGEGVATRFNSIPEDAAHNTFEEHLEVTITYCCSNGFCGICIGPACPK